MPNPVQQLVDAIDSYYEYVKGRVQTGDSNTGLPAINPARQFGGIVQAESWPMANTIDGGFYLTIIDQVPDNKFGTRGNPYYTAFLQWKWLSVGNNLSATQVGNNRGDRFRADQAMRQELIVASFPLFCPLISVSLDEDSGDIIKTPYSPVQVCRWTALSFGPRPSGTDDSGVLYGAAAVDVSTFQQPLTQ